MPTEWAIAAVLAGTCVATYLTRAGGFWLMSYVPVTQRVERLLRHLASSVFVAIVVGGAAKGDPAATVATAVSMPVMALTRKSPLAMAAGVAAAALWRLFGGR
jgi:uncharacterized membrane protein